MSRMKRMASRLGMERVVVLVVGEWMRLLSDPAAVNQLLLHFLDRAWPAQTF